MTHFAENQSAKRVPLPIWLLVAVHVAADLVLGSFGQIYGTDLHSATYLAILFAQISLLAMLAAFSESRLRRNLGAFTGLMFLFTTPLMTIPRLSELTLIFFLGGIWLVFAAMFIAFAMLNVGGYHLVRFGPDNPPPPAESLQFHLRHLFVVTAVVGLLMAPSKWIRENFESHGTIGLVIGIFLFVITPLLALWAVLGRGRVGQRSSLVLLSAVTMAGHSLLSTERPARALVLALLAHFASRPHAPLTPRRPLLQLSAACPIR